MKISIIANGFQEDYTLNLINALARQPVEIVFIGSNIYDKELLDSRITFLQARKEDRSGTNPFKKGYWVLAYFFWYLRYLIREAPMVIHIQWLRFNFMDGIFFPRLARLLGHTVVYTAHDVMPHSVDNPRMRRLFKGVYRSQNRIVAHTHYIKNRIIDEFHIDARKISVVKHGVYVVPEEKILDFANSKKALEIESDEFVLLFFGIITEYKGLDLLADALKLFKENTGEKVKLIVAGRIQAGYEEKMESLKEEQLGDDVIYFLRHISNEEVNLLFGSADITVLPYREASQSGVMFMSYAHGVPVIAPDLGGFSDDVREGQTGFLFDANNPENLSSIIHKALLYFKANNSKIRQEIIQLTREKYQWDDSAASLIEIYNDKI